MLEVLPTELQEQICSLLDGASLLRAASVCVLWNRIISGLQRVWHGVCLLDGFESSALDWKHQYVTCLRLLQRIRNGEAFQHRNFAPKCFQSSDVRDIAFWNGNIIAGIYNCIRIWRVADLKSVAVFDVPYEVFCLCVSCNGFVLGVGHYGGTITTLFLDTEQYEDDIKANIIQEYHGHTDNVVCLNIASEIDLICSGSRDKTVKLWCLSSGQLLNTLPTIGRATQVTLVPAACQNSIFENKHTLLTADQDRIQMYSWSIQYEFLYGDTNIMQVSNLSIPINKKVYMRKFLVQGKHIVYTEDGEIVIQNLMTLTKLKSFKIECREMVLLAIGARYLLATLWDSCQKNCRLAIVNISSGQLVGTYPMPLEYVVTGDTKWLNGVSHQKHHNLVAAGWMMGVLHMNQYTDNLYLITWLPEQQ